MCETWYVTKQISTMCVSSVILLNCSQAHMISYSLYHSASCWKNNINTSAFEYEIQCTKLGFQNRRSIVLNYQWHWSTNPLMTLCKSIQYLEMQRTKICWFFTPILRPLWLIATKYTGEIYILWIYFFFHGLFHVPINTPVAEKPHT